MTAENADAAGEMDAAGETEATDGLSGAVAAGATEKDEEGRGGADTETLAAERSSGAGATEAAAGQAGAR
jgi:hypothetical protein